MMQEINLYQPMFRKQKVHFSAVTMLQVSAFFLIVFTGSYFFQAAKIKPYQRQITEIESEIIELGTQLATMQVAKESKSKNTLLENEIEKLTKELGQRERISAILASRSFGNSSGFSSYLESFARGHVKGTWLTDVTIKEGGTSLGLKGKTLSSELVPVYIQRLTDEQSLKGSSFNVLELARVETEEAEESATELNFSISTN